MDRLPGLRRGLATGQRNAVEPIEKMVGPLAPENRRSVGVRTARQSTMLVVAVIIAFLLYVVFTLLTVVDA